MGPEVVRKVISSGRPFGSGVAYYKVFSVRSSLIA